MRVGILIGIFLCVLFMQSAIACEPLRAKSPKTHAACEVHSRCLKSSSKCSCDDALYKKLDAIAINGNLDEVFSARFLQGNVIANCHKTGGLIEQPKTNQKQNEEELNKRDALGVEVSLDSRANQWVIRGGQALDVDDNYFLTATGKLALTGYDGAPIIEVTREWNLSTPTDRRSDVLVRSDDKKAGEDKFKVNVGIGRVARMMIDKKRAAKTALSVIFDSTDIEYIETNANAVGHTTKPSLFISKGAQLSGNTIQGNFTALQGGERVNINTRFTEYRAGISLRETLGLTKIFEKFRIGVYDLSYIRATSSGGDIVDYYSCNGCATGQQSFIYDALHKSRGAYFDLRSLGFYGVTTGLVYRYGLDDSVTIRDTDISIYQGDPTYFGATFDIKYTMAFEQKSEWIGTGNGKIEISAFYDMHSWAPNSTPIIAMFDEKDSVDFLWGVKLNGSLKF